MGRTKTPKAKSNIAGKISKEKIALVVPTLGRTSLEMCLRKFAENCSVKSDIFIAYDVLAPDFENKLPDDVVADIFKDSIHDYHYTETKKNFGIGAARRAGSVAAMKNTNARFIFHSDDDACIGKDCVERILAVMIQEKDFVYVGPIGSYRRWWRDFTRETVKFYHCIGVFYGLRRDHLEACGNFDNRFRIGEDIAVAMAAWRRGKYVGVIDADVTHKRSLSVASKQLKEGQKGCMKLVGEEFSDMVKIAKNGSMRKQFDFPNLKYSLYDDYTLQKVKGQSW